MIKADPVTSPNLKTCGAKIKTIIIDRPQNIIF